MTTDRNRKCARAGWTAALITALVTGVVCAVSCGSSTTEVASGPPQTQEDAGDASQDALLDASFLDVPAADGQNSQQDDFVIQPADLTIDPVTAGQQVQFHAISKLTGDPIDVSGWYTDKLAAGTITAQGLFVATGTAGGEIMIIARTAAHQASATLTLGVHITENPGAVDATTQAMLEGGQAGAGPGNTPDGLFRWLYPYDRTVFPRGLRAPLLQTGGAGADAMYVHLQTKWYEYKGFFSASTPERAQLPQSAWDGLTWSAGDSDPVQANITKLQQGNITGPAAATWHIAQGSLKGFVYYNTYDDPMATQGGQLEETRRGAVLRIRPGAPKPDVVLGGDGTCTVCHSVSANGARMVLSSGHHCNKAYSLSPSGGPASETYSDDCSNDNRHDDTYSFGALALDGTAMLTSASMPRDPNAGYDYFPNLASVDDDTPRDSHLVNPATGELLAAPGFDGVVHKALMPAFSPDGTRVAFTHYEEGLGHALSVMKYASASHEFSSLEVVYDSRNYGYDDLYAGWPAFTPDGSAVVFQVGDRPDYSTWRGGEGELLIADLAAKIDRKLDALNGRDNGVAYVGDEHEARMSFEPTVLPVAVGGYYWVVFTSRRSYGNMIAEFGEGPDVPMADRPSPKKLWVAAIDIGYQGGGPDPSHPAFYLEGQDLVSGNMRGFWALEPCRQVDQSCESGSECCEGFCRAVETDAGAQQVCVPPPPECAQEDEKCTVSSECCDVAKGFMCINGFCARPTPPK